MSYSRNNATPEVTDATPTDHPPVRVSQREIFQGRCSANEAEVEQGALTGQQVMRAIGGGSPSAPPEQFAKALGGVPGRSQTSLLRQLQRSYGNSYVGRVIQAKLTVNQPGDIYEQEADRMAAQVMTIAAPQSDHSIQREIEPKKQKEKIQMMPSLQLVADGNQEVGENLENQLNSSKGGGSPLPNEVRSFMEPRFGADLSQVRVHTGGEAVQMNRELGAQAFTHGSDVYFGTGKPPGNNELTAHELTHVVQQTGSSTNSSIQRECGVDESCVKEPNASYPKPNYTPATANTSNETPASTEQNYTPADPNFTPTDSSASYATPMAAAGMLTPLVPGAPNTPLFETPPESTFEFPRIPGETPFNPNMGQGVEAAEAAEVGTTAAEVAEVGATVAEVAEVGTAAAVLGTEASIPVIGWIALGATVLAVGAYLGYRYLLSEDGQPTRPLTPQEEGQVSANPTPAQLPGQDGQNDTPAQLPGQEGQNPAPAFDPTTGELLYTPAVDPVTGEPLQAPSDQDYTPVEAGKVNPQDIDDDGHYIGKGRHPTGMQPPGTTSVHPPLEPWARSELQRRVQAGEVKMPKRGLDELAGEFMKWLQSGHAQGEPHEHLSPDSPEANDALSSFLAEQGALQIYR